MLVQIAQPFDSTSDNSTTFGSDEFEEFLQQCGVKRLTSGPHYPSFFSLNVFWLCQM